MPNRRLPFHKRIIFWMVVPVILVGAAVSGGLIAYLSPPMISYLTQHFETNLTLASDLGLGICEGYFTDLLNMRLEENLEMNKAMQNQALAEIRELSEQIPPVQLIVIENADTIRTSSTKVSALNVNQIPETDDIEAVFDFEIEAQIVKGHRRYFPFWNWTIVSFVYETDYQAPIDTAKRIVYLSTLSVFVTVLFALVFIFQRLVNLPLKRLIRVTENISDGKLVKVEKVETNELGRLSTSFNNMVDSLDREKAEVRHLLDELKQSENRFRTLFENTPIGICVAKTNGKVLETNESLLEMVGYSKDEIINHNVNQLLINSRDGNDILKLLNENNQVDYYETTLIRKDKTVCQARMTVTSTILDEQKVLIAMVEDITNQKKLELQLQRAQKMEAVGTLAGGVAHDLNNILSGLVSYPELILMKLPNDSKLRKPVKTIHKAGLRAATIVQDLLDLARRGVATKEIISLNDVIKEYFTSPEYEKLVELYPNVSIETELKKDLQNIFGSSVHLSKALMNLVLNAAEAIEGTGSIKIKTDYEVIHYQKKGFEIIPKGNFAVLNISDTGIGLTQEDKENIFEPFYTKKKMGRSGTGLGMTVVWGTVKDHDGFIDISSSPGLGTEFSLYFSITTEEKSTTTKDVDMHQYVSKGETVMFVDDNAEQRDILSEILNELKYTTMAAKSGEEAVELLKTNTVDLVILDMIMDPGMDGLDTYKAILNIHPKQKAIIASGYSETKRVKEAERLGVGQYIKKPFTMEEIGLAIRKELDP